MKRIRTLRDLNEAAHKRRCVIKMKDGPCWMNKPIPAAFLLSMSGRYLVLALRGGIKLYERKTDGS